MLFEFHVPHYFSKGVRQEIAELSTSTALADLAISMVMVFEPIFLYSVLHFTIPQILLFFGGTYLTYIICIPFGAKITSILGYRHTIVLSIPFQILFWVFMFASGKSVIFVILAPIFFGLEKSLFWPGFHAIVARYASKEQKGREFSFIYAIVNISQILGPLLGGFLAQKFSPGAAFFAAGIIYCTSAIPLLLSQETFAPKLYEFKDTLRLYKDFPKKFLGYMGFGEELLGLVVWPVFIFLVVKNYEGTGILATGASFFAAILALIIGKVADTYTKRVLIKIGAFLTSLVWFMHPLANSFFSTFAVDSLARTSKDVVFIPLSTVTYLRAESSHIMPYVVFYEQSLAIGKLSACIIGSILFVALGAGTAGFIGLFVLAGLYSLLYMFI